MQNFAQVERIDQFGSDPDKAKHLRSSVYTPESLLNDARRLAACAQLARGWQWGIVVIGNSDVRLKVLGFHKVTGVRTYTYEVL